MPNALPLKSPQKATSPLYAPKLTNAKTCSHNYSESGRGAKLNWVNSIPYNSPATTAFRTCSKTIPLSLYRLLSLALLSLNANSSATAESLNVWSSIASVSRMAYSAGKSASVSVVQTWRWMLGDCSFCGSRPLYGDLRLRGANAQNLTAKKSTVTVLTEEYPAASTAVVRTVTIATPDIPLAYF